ncbi:hypothetical protein ACWD69_16455, partial [Micromonospora chokoriensis]
MSNNQTTPDDWATAAPPGKGRRKLWVAAGLAGLTGVVGLAALGGLAARDDEPGGRDRTSGAQSSAKQPISDAGQADDEESHVGADKQGGQGPDVGDWDNQAGDDKGQGERGKDDKGRSEDRDRVREVDCD